MKFIFVVLGVVSSSISAVCCQQENSTEGLIKSHTANAAHDLYILMENIQDAQLRNFCIAENFVKTSCRSSLPFGANQSFNIEDYLNEVNKFKETNDFLKTLIRQIKERIDRLRGDSGQQESDEQAKAVD